MPLKAAIESKSDEEGLPRRKQAKMERMSVKSGRSGTEFVRTI